jgi:hypothetical protein
MKKHAISKELIQREIICSGGEKISVSWQNDAFGHDDLRQVEHFNLLYHIMLILLQETSLLGQSCGAVDGKHSSLLISYAVKLLLGWISFIQ